MILNKGIKMSKLNQNVLNFIENVTTFPDYGGDNSLQIDHLFSAGYCFYFAVMLQSAFGGTICWPEGHSHIVWLDGDDLEHDVAYDIGGVYYDYEKLRPISYLGNMIVDFKHNGEVYASGNKKFAKLAEKEGIPEATLLSKVWMSIPKDILHRYDAKGFNLEQTVFAYLEKKGWKYDHTENDTKRSA